MSTDDGLDHCWGRNSEFCVTVSPVTRNVGILGWYADLRSYAGLIRSNNPSPVNFPKYDIMPYNMEIVS